MATLDRPSAPAVAITDAEIVSLREGKIMIRTTGALALLTLATMTAPVAVQAARYSAAGTRRGVVEHLGPHAGRLVGRATL
jgi:hypothetical protein